MHISRQVNVGRPEDGSGSANWTLRNGSGVPVFGIQEPGAAYISPR